MKLLVSDYLVQVREISFQIRPERSLQSCAEASIPSSYSMKGRISVGNLFEG